MLRCYVDSSDDWETYLYLVLFVYSTSKHASTGIAPFQVARKLDKRWEVTEIKSPVNGVIKNIDGRVKVVHVNRLQRLIRKIENGFGELRFDDFNESSGDWQTSISNRSGITPHNGNCVPGALFTKKT